MKHMKIALSALLAVALLFLASCSDVWAHATYTEDTTLGEGSSALVWKVTADGKTVTFTIHTDKETLADALLEHDLIEGEYGAYGIYIKVANGISADYDLGGYYWALYKNGEYMLNGADSEAIDSTAVYEFIRTK